jgi:hypothetical protein
VNRIKDYSDFAAWFSGLGYIALWPLTSPDLGGKPFGASLLCRDGSLSLLDLLCNSAHPLQLPPALHGLGILAAAFVTVRLLLYAVRRLRRAAAARAAEASALVAQTPVAIQPPPRRKPAPARRPVKPRTHFGLRGMPH